MIRNTLARLAVSGFVVSLLALTTGCGDQAAKIALFNGKDMQGWQAMDPNNSTWLVAATVAPSAADEKLFATTTGEGILVNGPTGKTSNIFTTSQHGDCHALIEFMVPKGSNSGVYFQGRYEIQVFDSYGKPEVTFSDCGGIYARWINDQNVEGHAPMVNASQAPGEWQTFDVTFRAPRFGPDGKKTENAKFIKVIHNGKLVHENVSLNGPTRASMLEDEAPLGPIMLQGDHGPVAYRIVSLTPLKLD